MNSKISGYCFLRKVQITNPSRLDCENEENVFDKLYGKFVKHSKFMLVGLLGQPEKFI